VFAASIIRVMMMELVNTLETSVKFYQTAWHKIPEDRHPDECPQVAILWCQKRVKE
jgi:hypothetical protein